MSLSVVRIEFYGLLIRIQCIVVIARVVIGNAQIEPGGRVLRVGFDRFLIRRYGLVALIQPVINGGLVIACGRIIWVYRQCFLKCRQGFIVFVLFIKQHTAKVCGIGRSGAGRVGLG